MGRRDTSLEWGGARRFTNSDQDTQIKQTSFGAKLFGLLGGKSYSTQLFKDNEIFNIRNANGKEMITVVPGTESVKITDKFEVNPTTLYINKEEVSFETIISSTNDEAFKVNSAGVILNDDGHATNDFRVESDDNTHMLFVDSGANNIGIGTDSPANIDGSGMDIKGTNHATLVIRTTGASNDAQIKLCNIGDIKWTIWSDGGASDTINCVPVGSGAGCYIAQTGTVWLAVSDERIKENIVDLDKGLSTVLAMKPRRFNFKESHGGLEDIGFIAQELNTVLPEVVDGDESNYRIRPAEVDDEGNEVRPERIGGLMGLSNQKIVPVLVNAIQELSAKIDTMQTEINNLKAGV